MGKKNKSVDTRKQRTGGMRHEYVISDVNTNKYSSARAVSATDTKMEVFVDATSFSSWSFPEDSAVRDILNRFFRLQVGNLTEQ